MAEEHKTRGGHREGCGRKRKSEHGRVQLQLSLTEEQRAKIKELAKEAGSDVSSFVLSKVLN